MVALLEIHRLVKHPLGELFPGTQVLGNGYQIGARAIYRLAGETTDQSFSLGFDYKDFKQNIVLKDNSITKSPIRYIPLNLGYTWSKAGDKSQLEFNMSATLGLRVIRRFECVSDGNGGCSVEDQFSLRDYNARENFAHINADITWTRLIADE
jgi:hypothetical protein